MKNKMILLLSTVMVLIFSAMSFGVTVNIDGESKALVLDVKEGRSYISSKSLREFGFTTRFEGDHILLTHDKVTFDFTNHTNQVMVNDVPLTLDATVYNVGDAAFVPLKFVFETLNYDIGWSSPLKKITMHASGETPFPLVIYDGNMQYKFTQPVKSIVSLAPSVTESLFAIGAGDLVVGRTLYCDYPSQTASIRTVGTLYEPDLEGIIDIKPDVVIAATHMNEDVMTTLSKANIQTVTQASPEKINEIYTFILKLGQLTDHNYEARALVSSLEGKEDRIRQVVATIPSSQKKTGYYVVGTGQYGEYTAGNGTFISEVIETAGITNVAKDVEGWNYSLEQLIDHNPQVILAEAYNYDTMKESSNYKALSAINKGSVIIVDGNVFSRPGPRVIDLGMKQIIHELYPTYEHLLKY